ncbi:MAG: hypothetical protein ACOX2L_01770 [Anaerolineae bacterium]|jgi:uncharacterized protein (DUF697 family)|nr:hypothetical protein [Chloroflexota bacterium]
MVGLGDVADVWRNLKEVDLKPIAEEALTPLRVVLAGRAGARTRVLGNALRVDPYHPEEIAATPLVIRELSAERLPAADLVIIIVPPSAESSEPEQELARALRSRRIPVLTILDRDTLTNGELVPAGPNLWLPDSYLTGDVSDPRFLERTLVPATLQALPQRHLALARQLPLFRNTVARRLIEEVSQSNATYALTTGLAGIIPVLNVPLNVTDMLVLTKAQAFMVYRLGLALGMATEWRDYVREFGGVIGGGFVWRSLARTLVGLLPGLGLVPKVAIAWSGTFVTGNIVWHWYLNGGRLPTERIQALYRDAAQAGRTRAREMVDRYRRQRQARRMRRDQQRAERPRRRPWRLSAGPGESGERSPRYCRFCGEPLPSRATVCRRCNRPVREALPESDSQ